jgi:hypothetical protein
VRPACLRADRKQVKRSVSALICPALASEVALPVNRQNRARNGVASFYLQAVARAGQGRTGRRPAVQQRLIHRDHRDAR